MQRSTSLNKIAKKNQPMANMRRIRQKSRTVRSALRPGTVIMTDDGLLGRVRRLTSTPGAPAVTQLEVDDLEGGTALVSSQDIRLVYG
jgi:hypothetical protein